MWINLANAHFSIVPTADLAPGQHLVRARRPGDRQRYIPMSEVRR